MDRPGNFTILNSNSIILVGTFQSAGTSTPRKYNDHVYRGWEASFWIDHDYAKLTLTNIPGLIFFCYCLLLHLSFCFVFFFFFLLI